MGNWRSGRRNVGSLPAAVAGNTAAQFSSRKAARTKRHRRRHLRQPGLRRPQRAGQPLRPRSSPAWMADSSTRWPSAAGRHRPGDGVGDAPAVADGIAPSADPGATAGRRLARLAARPPSAAGSSSEATATSAPRRRQGPALASCRTSTRTALARAQQRVGHCRSRVSRNSCDDVHDGCLPFACRRSCQHGQGAPAGGGRRLAKGAQGWARAPGRRRPADGLGCRSWPGRRTSSGTSCGISWRPSGRARCRRAARALDVEHSTIRRRLLALEQALAAPLFNRSPDGLTPTPAGDRADPAAGGDGAGGAGHHRAGALAQDARPPGHPLGLRPPAGPAPRRLPRRPPRHHPGDPGQQPAGGPEAGRGRPGHPPGPDRRGRRSRSAARSATSAGRCTPRTPTCSATRPRPIRGSWPATTCWDSRPASARCPAPA